MKRISDRFYSSVKSFWESKYYTVWKVFGKTKFEYLSCYVSVSLVTNTYSAMKNIVTPNG